MVCEFSTNKVVIGLTLVANICDISMWIEIIVLKKIYKQFCLFLLYCNFSIQIWPSMNGMKHVTKWPIRL